jgi:hypothetical protein
MKTIAKRTDRKTFPIDKPKLIEISMQFTNEQFEKLKKGLIPKQMEDKWFIFYEKGWLYFHRSWTGFGTYKAQLIKEKDGYSIKEFRAERNKKKYSNEDDNEDRNTLAFLIAAGLLGIDAGSIYADRNIKSGKDALKEWSDFGRMMFGDKDDDFKFTIED